MSRPRVVVAGLGDTGLLTAIHLSRRYDVVGVSTKPGLVSGQELGTRLTRPEEWARNYWIPFDRFRRLDGVRTLHGTLTGVDLTDRCVQVRAADGTPLEEPYDVLVIATGVTNGFWRRPDLEDATSVADGLRADHEQLRSASSVIVVGGGAAAVNSAANIAMTWPHKRVDLHFPGEAALPRHHPRVWHQVARRLDALGVGMHPRHRAELPDGFTDDRMTCGPVVWSTGQPPATADLVLWAVGRVQPNTAWLPRELLDDNGFVRVLPDLRVPGHGGVFAVGDVAATDPLRSSARNRADKLLARNVASFLSGGRLQPYRPPKRRWGSVLGVQPDGYQIFSPTGRAFRFPPWTVDAVLWPWLVRRAIYRGVRDG